MTDSSKKLLSGILAASMMMAMIASCFVIPSSAVVTLSDLREQLRGYITELYVKGPSVGSSAVALLRSSGAAKEYDEEAGDYKIFADRLEFEMSLASSDPYDDYFFLDDNSKLAFLATFDKDAPYDFLDGVYRWYPLKSVAQKSGLTFNQNNDLIRYNLTNLISYACEVYAFCAEEDSFSVSFNNARSAMLSEAIDAVYRVIAALRSQIGSGDSKPKRYKKEYARTFCTEADGVYPYLNKDLKNYTIVLDKYIDDAAYTEKTFKYSEAKANTASAAALAAFESVYASFKQNTDSGVLYYDYLQAVKPVKDAYAALCASLIAPSEEPAAYAAKADAYYKIRNLAEAYGKYILPYQDNYSSQLDLVTINANAIKALTGFVRDDPCFINSLSAEEMTKLAEDFAESVKKLSPLAEYTVKESSFAAGSTDLAAASSFMEKYTGIPGDAASAAYLRLENSLAEAKAFAAETVRTYPNTEVASFGGKKVPAGAVSFTFTPSQAVYENYLLSALREADGFFSRTQTDTPVNRPVEDGLSGLREIIDRYAFLVGDYNAAISSVTGKISEASVSDSSKALLSAALRKLWNVSSVSENSIDDIASAYLAVKEYYIYKTGKSTVFPQSSELSVLENLKDTEGVAELLCALFENSLKLLDTDMTLYALALRSAADSVADLFGFNTVSDPDYKDVVLYAVNGSFSSFDGKDPINPLNYATGILENIADEINSIKKLCDAELGYTASEKRFLYILSQTVLTNSVYDALSDLGRECFDNYMEALPDVIGAYNGKTGVTPEIFANVVSTKGITAAAYMKGGSCVADYYDFKVAACAANDSETANKYRFSDDMIVTNLVNPIQTALNSLTSYAPENLDLINAATTLAASVDRSTKTVKTDLTCREAQAILTAIGKLASDTAQSASYRASKLDALVDSARAKTINSSDSAPYYKLLGATFTADYTAAVSVASDKNASLEKIDAAADRLREDLDAIAVYEKAAATFVVSTKDLESAIAEAEKLLSRCDVPGEPVTVLSAILNASRDVLEKKRTTITSDEIKSEISRLQAAIDPVRASALLDDNLRSAISSAIKSVTKESDYTSASWKPYADALNAANAAAADTSSKVSVCTAARDALEKAVAALEPAPEPAAEPAPEEQKTEPSSENQAEDQAEDPTENSAENAASDSSFRTESAVFFEASFSDYMKYLITPGASKEKAEAWKASLQELKAAIDANADETTVLQTLAAVQLAKSIIPVINPETSDN